MDMLEINFGVQIFGFLLHIIALSTTGWLAGNNWHFGLFKICYKDYCNRIHKVSGSFKMTKGLSCLGFLILLVAAIMATVYIFKHTLRNNRKYRWAVSILLIVGGTLAFIAPLISFGIHNFSPSYSSYLAILAGIISLIAGILHGVTIRRTVFE